MTKNSITLLLGMVLLIGVGLISSVWLASNSGRLAQILSPQPETFTELYFEDHLELPKSVLPTIPFQVAYSIRNLESQDMTYPVEVFAQTDRAATTSGEIIPLVESEIAVRRGATATQVLDLAVPPIATDTGQRAKITIKLSNLNQTIHFYFNVAATPSANLNTLNRLSR